MWRCFVRDQARVPSVAGAGSSLFRKTEQFFFYLLVKLSDGATPWERVLCVALLSRLCIVRLTLYWF